MPPWCPTGQLGEFTGIIFAYTKKHAGVWGKHGNRKHVEQSLALHTHRSRKRLGYMSAFSTISRDHKCDRSFLFSWGGQVRGTEKRQNLFLLNTSRRTEFPILWAKAGMCGVVRNGSSCQMSKCLLYRITVTVKIIVSSV